MLLACQWLPGQHTQAAIPSAMYIGEAVYHDSTLRQHRRTWRSQMCHTHLMEINWMEDRQIFSRWIRMLVSDLRLWTSLTALAALCWVLTELTWSGLAWCKQHDADVNVITKFSNLRLPIMNWDGSQGCIAKDNFLTETSSLLDPLNSYLLLQDTFHEQHANIMTHGLKV